MKVFIMSIFLLQIDVGGYPFTTPFEENPRIEFNTITECINAAKDKRNKMLESSLNYLELGIVDVKIDCIETKQSKEGTI